MHIPGSLFLGGYDQSKVLGPVSTLSYGYDFLPIEVAEGASPLNYTSKSGLLGQGNSSIGESLSVLVDATLPFLYLPRSSCDAITEDLPVVYDDNYGLYIWNVEDPHYHIIVTSPLFLQFTFRLNSSIVLNMTVDVPFPLLNLNLTSPLVTSSTPYFPCTPYSSGRPYGQYSLGRAFLQAAFIGVNWDSGDDGVWFLAQAPGPNTPSISNAMAIHPTDTYLTPSTNKWVDTWKGYWTPMEDASTKSGNPSSNNNSTATASTSSGLSVGLKRRECSNSTASVRNASVVPEPVVATPNISRPSRRTGIAFYWISFMSVYPIAAMASTRDRSQGAPG